MAEVLLRKEIELVPDLGPLLLQMVIHALEVGNRILVLLLVLFRGVLQFFLVLNLNYKDEFAFFYEKILAELSPLDVIAFLPGIVDLIEPGSRGF